MMKHILFVGLYPNPVEIYQNIFFQNLIFAIRDEGYRCTVIAPVSITKYKKHLCDIPKKTIHYTSLGNDVEVYYPRTVSFSSKKIGRLRLYRLTEWAFRKSASRCAKQILNVDAVYGHFLLRGGLTALEIARKKKVEGYIAYGECSFKSEVAIPYGKILKKQLNGLAGIITVSSKNKKELLSNLDISKEKILLAPNSIDDRLFRPIDRFEAEQKLGLSSTNSFVVGFVGGFIERKGDKRLLCAINQLENVEGMFAGKGKDVPQGEKVRFCKALQHDMLPYFYNAIDVFVLPTLAEGCSNAIVEAIACGKPVISSRLDFNYDILDESNSILINPESVDEIRDAIYKLQNNQQLVARLSKGALMKAKELTISVRAKKITEFMFRGDEGNEKK